ncbi:IS5 family transposase [Kitasatospora sp. NPDC057223]|uniref:IS5 family transposase n=1 Tax=Kitasatospora sp. NPDC057223 TaxID=3346055 RepID=UPI00363344EF
MGSAEWGWIVPDGLWEVVEPLLPATRVRQQGGGTANLDDRAVFAAVVYVLTTGCAWRHLPPCFGVSKSTVHRRFTIWSKDGLWGRVRRVVLERLVDAEVLDLTRVVVDSVHVRAKKGGEHTGPSPVDRGKPGSKVHVLSDRNGLPLVVGISSANTHDQHGLTPLVEALLAKHDHERGLHLLPRKLHADKAYDNAELRKWLRRQQVPPRIARKGIESRQTLGRHRWVIERTMSWLTGYRRIARRYERDHRHYLAFCDLAAVITCHKRLSKTTT